MKNNWKLKNIILILIICSLVACSKTKTEKEAAESSSIEVVIGNPTRQKMIEYLDLNATTIFQKQEIVRTTFAGFIEKSYKNIGETVKPGELLFLIKTKEADATDSLGLDAGNKRFSGEIRITARTAGIMTELYHQTGDYVADGDQLATVVNPASMKIMLNVPFKYSGLIGINSNYTVTLPNGKFYQAKVIRKVPSIDQVNQTESYLMELADKLQLPSNLNLIVKIPQKTVPDALILPKSAVMTNEVQSEFWLMKLINDSVAVKLNITKGLENDSSVQILSPMLDLNDKFIIEGAYGLADTTKIS